MKLISIHLLFGISSSGNSYQQAEAEVVPSSSLVKLS